MIFVLLSWHCVVAKQPLIVLSAVLWIYCSFDIYAFERVEDQVDEPQFKLEHMDCL